MADEKQVALLARETRSSIELKRNAKGEYAWDIKVYFEEGFGGDAVITLRSLDGSLRSEFLDSDSKEE